MKEQEILLAYPWINKDLFERIIKKDFPESSTEVKDFSVESALPTGENYASLMIRATVNYLIDNQSDVEKRFIIKAGLVKEELKSILSDIDLFGKEIRMFRDILPKMKELLENIGENIEFSAK